MNTTQNSKELLIINFLIAHKSKWVKGYVLRNYANIKGSVEMRRLIKILRIKGNLIIASRDGYKLIDTKNYKDIREFHNYLDGRKKEIKSEVRVLNLMERFR